ncbi:hypothetical protein GCM10010405_59490 [Streptomyces macrosporus]|uniref:Uncharacterized protein n=1 Tax=Streptomyces macrosporus TaxID=44032 RepID=A0ABN3KMB6_9ACTN
MPTAFVVSGPRRVRWRECPGVLGREYGKGGGPLPGGARVLRRVFPRVPACSRVVPGSPVAVRPGCREGKCAGRGEERERPVMESAEGAIPQVFRMPPGKVKIAHRKCERYATEGLRDARR